MDFQQAVDLSKSIFPNASSIKAAFLRELDAAALSGRKATDAERVSEFCLAFCDIIRCGAERTISTNWPAVPIEHVVEFSKTVVLRLAPYATTAESVQNLFLCIAGCVAQGQSKDPLLSDRRNVFATASIRDELFVPRAQYATTPCSVQWLLAALCCLMEPAAGALPRRAVFATPNVRDGIFATVARHASNISSNQRVFSAIHFLTCKSGSDEEVALRRDIFATESVRDAVFVTSTQFLLADMVVGWLATLADITSGDDAGASRRRNMFATGAFLKDVLVPLARNVFTANEAQQLFTVICNLTERCDGESNSDVGVRRDLFATLTARDNMMILATRAAKSSVSVLWLHKALLHIYSGTDANAAERLRRFSLDNRQIFQVSILDAFFKNTAKHATTGASVSAFFDSIELLTRPIDDSRLERSHVTAHGQRKQYFGKAHARVNICFAAGSHANTTHSVESMLSAFLNIATGRFGEEFAHSSLLDFLVTKARYMTTPVAVRLLFQVLTHLIWQQRHDDSFAARARDHLFLPLAEHATTDDAVAALFSALTAFNTDGGDCVALSVFRTAEVRDRVFVPLAKHATNFQGITALLTALGVVVTAPNQDVFATVAVRDEIFLQSARHMCEAGLDSSCLLLFLTALKNLLDGADAAAEMRRDLFATPELAAFMLEAFPPRINKPSIGCRWCEVMKLLCTGEGAGAANRRRIFDIAPSDCIQSVAEQCISSEHVSVLAPIIDRSSPASGSK